MQFHRAGWRSFAGAWTSKTTTINANVKLQTSKIKRVTLIKSINHFFILEGWYTTVMDADLACHYFNDVVFGVVVYYASWYHMENGGSHSLKISQGTSIINTNTYWVMFILFSRLHLIISLGVLHNIILSHLLFIIQTNLYCCPSNNRTFKMYVHNVRSVSCFVWSYSEYCSLEHQSVLFMILIWEMSILLVIGI